MIPVLRSLSSIRTDYAYFEHDQVLTEAHLNSLAEYADDQLRLSRIKLTGVGVISGLRLSLSATRVALSSGVGITTDGDLVWLDKVQQYTHFKRFDSSRPVYEPFWRTGDGQDALIPLFELLPEGTQDPEAIALSLFATTAGFALTAAVGIAYVESYHQDKDQCTGTDCDNLGMERRNTQHLLLAHPKAIGSLNQAPTTPRAAFSAMGPVSIQRPVLTSTLTTPVALWQAFAGPIRAGVVALSSALATAFEALSPHVPDAFTTNPVSAWQSALAGVGTRFAPSGNTQGAAGYEYAYDLLKDIAESLSALRDSVLEDDTWLCTKPERFPKHLLLGTIGSTAESMTSRTRFTPSPAVSLTARAVDRARFLLRKIDAQLRAFQVNVSASSEVRITPSAFEDRPLEDRAIPWYYAVSSKDANNLLYLWSQRLSRRGETLRALSYHAPSYSVEAAVMAPLSVQIGATPYFRIEGHLGGDVDEVKASIEAKVKASNLSFAVETVFIGNDPARVRPRPRPYTDLHRLHHLFRADVVQQLNTVTSFGDTLKTKVTNKVSAGTVSAQADDNEGADILGVSTNRAEAIRSRTASVTPTLQKSYSAFRADTSWISPIRDTVGLAGGLKKELGPVAKTEYQTPIDTFVASPQLQWVDWIGRIIDHKEQQDDERWLLSKFIAEHPGAEHIAGVLRGGTFVLLYDERDVVVADLALPYRCCAERVVDEVEAQPELPTLDIRPPTFLEDAITLQPSRTKFVTDIADAKTTKVQTDLTLAFEPKLNAQASVLALLKDNSTQMANSMTSLANTYTGVMADSFTPTKVLADSVEAADILAGRLVGNDAEIVKEITVLNEEQAALTKMQNLLNKQIVASTGTPQEVELEVRMNDIQKRLADSVLHSAKAISRAEGLAVESTAVKNAIANSTAILEILPETERANVDAALKEVASNAKAAGANDAVLRMSRK